MEVDGPPRALNMTMGMKTHLQQPYVVPPKEVPSKIHVQRTKNKCFFSEKLLFNSKLIILSQNSPSKDYGIWCWYHTIETSFLENKSARSAGNFEKKSPDVERILVQKFGQASPRCFYPFPQDFAPSSRAIFFGGNFPPKKKHSGTPQAENFWVLKEARKRFYQLLFDRQNTGIFVHCKECVFFITYLDLLVERREVTFSKHFATVFFGNLFLQIF